MKKLYLTSEQARELGYYLIKYAEMRDSKLRSLFEGFEISFGDTLANKPQPDGSFEVTPIAGITKLMIGSGVGLG